MAATTLGPNHSSSNIGGSERSSNPNIVGSNPNLNNLLNRGTTIDNHNNHNNNNSTSSSRERGERQSRHHAPPLASMREYCLRWNNHQPNLVTFFTTLLTKESFVDVTLVSSEGRKIQAHKLVLSACSPYFQHVFENNPCKHPIVILKDVQYADLRTIINFIYNGEVNIAQDRMNTILAIAGTLQVKGLAEVPADELKRVGGPKSSDHSANNARHTSSPWTSGESDNPPISDVPRKRLKRGNMGGASQSTNGDLSTSGSFESGVGASVSRSIDDGTTAVVQGLDGGGTRTSSKSPPVTTTRGLPPLTAASTTKSKSLDTGLDKERREGGGSADSELSSGGYSENQNFDENSAGAERGYDLEVADVKMDDVDNEEGGELEFDEDDAYGPDDNPEYGDPSYLNMPASTSASYFQPPGLHFGARMGSGKERRGRPLLRQPRIKRQEEIGGRDMDTEGFSASVPTDYLSSSGPSQEVDSDSIEAEAAAAAYKEKRFGISKKDTEGPTSSGIVAEDKVQFLRQQSTVPILLVSGSSPTPPSSPQQLSIDESESSSVPLIQSRSSEPNQPLTSKLLSIPVTPALERITGSGSIMTGQSGGPVLLKQVSQPLLPSSHAVMVNPTMTRQHSTPAPVQHSSSSRLLQAATAAGKPGTVTYILPHSMSEESYGESTYIVDTNTGLIQILSPVPDVSRSGGTEGSYTRIPHTGNKDMEIYKAEGSVSESLSSMDDPSVLGGGSASTSFSVSMDEDPSSGGEVPVVQRSGHCPVLRPGPALGCNFCWNSVDQCGRILRRKTKYHCPECHINLCIVPCFQEYHEKADKKKPKPKLPKPSSM